MNWSSFTTRMVNSRKNTHLCKINFTFRILENTIGKVKRVNTQTILIYAVYYIYCCFCLQNQETTNKGCVGPDSLYIKLISSDGHEFIIKRKNALLSGTIAAMLGSSGEFLETKTNEIHLRETQ